jgi:2-phospho-L-lactate guanylyltransferase (CobY/MobA/RfbA family)
MSLAMLTMMSNSLRKIAEQIEILVKRAPMQVRMTESEIKENARVK